MLNEKILIKHVLKTMTLVKSYVVEGRDRSEELPGHPHFQVSASMVRWQTALKLANCRGVIAPFKPLSA
jgi:hypothetical protein